MELKLIHKSVEDLGVDDIETRSIDLVVTSPPYKKKDGYSDGLMKSLGDTLYRVLKPGGRVFFNFGQLQESFDRPYWAASLVAEAAGLHMGQTIAWIKSIAIGDEPNRGHFQPVNSPRILNYCWEPIFTMWKDPHPELDKLAIGVPYADKGNLTRGTRGKNGDIHCRGDAWFIPYETTGASNKKGHDHEYPEALVRMCIKVAGVGKGACLFEPFCGSGTTVAVALSEGLSAVATDIEAENLKGAQERCQPFMMPPATVPPTEHKDSPSMMDGFEA